MQNNYNRIKSVLLKFSLINSPFFYVNDYLKTFINYKYAYIKHICDEIPRICYYFFNLRCKIIINISVNVNVQQIKENKIEF